MRAQSREPAGAELEFEMLPFVVLAVISAWDLDDGAPSPPPSLLGPKVAGAGLGSAQMGSDDGSATSLVKFCTFGAPPLGPHLFSDASDLTRTFTTPSCDDGTNPLQAGLASQALLGVSYPFGLMLPWQHLVTPGAPVHLTETAPPSRQPSPSLSAGVAALSNFALRFPQGDRTAPAGRSTTEIRTLAVHRNH